MGANIYLILFNAACFGFVGFIVGELKGYSKGLSSACDIWEESLKQVTSAFIESLKKNGEIK